MPCAELATDRYELVARRKEHNPELSVYRDLGDAERGNEPDIGRCDEFAVFLGDRLVAVSFLAIGREAVSSIYGIFDPDDAKRSPS